MPKVLLFVVTESAKPFVQKVMSLSPGRGGWFYLVESERGPADGQQFRNHLAENGEFESAFIGASDEICCAWALEKQFEDKSIVQNFIAIVDERSSSNDTITVHSYHRNPGWDFGTLGILPPEHNKWYSFRIKYDDFHPIFADLSQTAPDASYPVYFGHKDKLTDEHGVFNVKKAQALISQPSTHDY